MMRSSPGRGQAKPLIIAGAVLGDGHGEHGTALIQCARETGFEVLDLGADVPPARFAGAVREHRPLALVLSCQLPVCASGVGRVIEELERQGLRDAARVLVGGAALTAQFAREVGADSFATDPTMGAAILRAWIDS